MFTIQGLKFFLFLLELQGLQNYENTKANRVFALGCTDESDLWDRTFLIENNNIHISSTNFKVLRLRTQVDSNMF
jgi:hypothetical protein